MVQVLYLQDLDLHWLFALIIWKTDFFSIKKESEYVRKTFSWNDHQDNYKYGEAVQFSESSQSQLNPVHKHK